MEAPVLLLAFANDADAHLDLLSSESKGISRVLKRHDMAGSIRVEREESADLEVIFDSLSLHREDVVIFHYSGHADGAQLRLEGGGGHVDGLAQLLGELPKLKLVFLNGCATKGQLDVLVKAGVKAVIATSVPIRDDKARDFAIRLYQALGEGSTIGQAFTMAEGYLASRYRDHTQVGIVGHRGVTLVDSGEAIPWGLYYDEDGGKDAIAWTIPAAQAHRPGLFRGSEWDRFLDQAWRYLPPPRYALSLAAVIGLLALTVAARDADWRIAFLGLPILVAILWFWLLAAVRSVRPGPLLLASGWLSLGFTLVSAGVLTSSLFLERLQPLFPIEQFVVKGTVLAISGEPIADALVEMPPHAHWDSTDARGRFELPPLLGTTFAKDNEITLRVTHSAFRQQSVVDSLGGPEVEVVISLDPGSQ